MLLTSHIAAVSVSKIYISSSLLVHYLYKDFRVDPIPALFCLITSCLVPSTYIKLHQDTSQDVCVFIQRCYKLVSYSSIDERKPKISKTTPFHQVLYITKLPKTKYSACFLLITNILLYQRVVHTAWNNMYTHITPPPPKCLTHPHLLRFLTTFSSLH